MQLSKPNNATILLLALMCILVLSCSDSPENQAAKEIRQKITDALDIVSSIDALDKDMEPLTGPQREEEILQLYEKAQAKVKSALSQGRQAGVGVDSVLLVSSNLAFEQAQHMQIGLHNRTELMNDMVSGLWRLTRKTALLKTERERAENLLSTIETEAAQLEKHISAQGDTPGLEAQLAAKEAELEQLQRQKSQFESKRREAINSENQVQQLADAKFRESELATGMKKLELERKGYEILQTRGSSILQNMSAKDQIDRIESQISIVAPIVVKLQQDLDKALQRLDDVKSSSSRSELRELLKDVDGQVSEIAAQTNQFKTELQNASSDYTERVVQIQQLQTQASVDYKKIRSSSAAMVAKVRLANCYVQMANMSVESMQLFRNIAFNLEMMASASEQGTALSELAVELTETGGNYTDKALESYDEALKVYGQLDMSGKRLGDQFACDVTKSYLLVLNGRITLAEELEDFDTADELLAKVDELMEKARKFGTLFTKSAAANILSGSADYIPAMSVDNTAYYEGIRKQFQTWKRLKGEEKETEVNRLLALGQEKKAEFVDEEFDKIINPEIKQLEDALAKGFDEEEIVVITDPNYM